MQGGVAKTAPPKPNYNRLAKNRKKWNQEARSIVKKLSNHQHASKVKRTLFNYEEVRTWY